MLVLNQLQCCSDTLVEQNNHTSFFSQSKVNWYANFETQHGHFFGPSPGFFKLRSRYICHRCYTDILTLTASHTWNLNSDGPMIALVLFNAKFRGWKTLPAPRFDPSTFWPTFSCSYPIPFITVVWPPFVGPLSSAQFIWGTLQRSPANGKGLNQGFPRVCISRESGRAQLHLQFHATGTT